MENQPKNFWQGEKISLRAVEPEDWEVYHAWNDDTEAARAAYFIPFPQSKAAERKHVEEEALRRGEDDVYRWQIVDREGKIVGTINTHSIDRRNGTFSYGLAVKREEQRKGYAAEAIRIVLRYYFLELRYQKCTVGVYSFNEPSIRLHERLGFTLEGRLRRMIYTNGQYYDDMNFGITLQEFLGSGD
jgi:RimJ/RimL family protein N-acetyltransferase